MKRGIDNGFMVNSLNANHWNIRNLGGFDTVPPEFVDTNDSRLSDPRPPLDGAVTNDSVADDAAIRQSKLDLSDNIPASFLGVDAAARGDLVQPLTAKDAAGGYASLNAQGKLQSGSTPIAGTGTLHDIDFLFPIDEVATMPTSVTTTRLFTGFWAAQNAETWFGNTTGASARPTFYNHEFPEALIPTFDASRITSERFSTDQIPVAVGVGVSHAPGIVPPPQSIDTDSTASPTDYLGRDMIYHAMVTLINYQPQLSPTSISVMSYYQGQARVNITSSVDGTNIFYAVGNNPFVEAFPGTLPILVDVGVTVQSYSAKIGFTNSMISNYIIPPDPGPTPSES